MSDFENYKIDFENNKIQEFIKEMRKNDGILENRFFKFEKYLENNSFDDLMLRIIEEHNDNWINNCYLKNCKPYPNNKLSFILEYVERKGEKVIVNEIKSNFVNEIFEFKGYYFQMIYGQGVITKIYNKADKRILLVI